MSQPEHWDTRYQTGNTPWDTGEPSSMLMGIVAEERIPLCRAIDLGCGTGVNSVWLAQQGFDVVGVDVSTLAIKRARERAAAAGVKAHFVAADLLQPLPIEPPFRFFFDRGCYHIIRTIDLAVYFQTLAGLLERAALGVVLAGNAREPMDPGPPVVTEEELRQEWGQHFEVIWVREFRFDQPPGEAHRPLAWAALVRRN